MTIMAGYPPGAKPVHETFSFDLVWSCITELLKSNPTLTELAVVWFGS
jgi:hypothetical protein